MAASSLQQHLVEAGRKLLLALDHAGVRPQGAAWVFDHALGDWRYVVATSLVDTMGRSTVYRMLIAVLKHASMPEELTVADIHLVSPADPLFRAINSVFEIQDATVTFENCGINGIKFDAVVYRWTGKPSQADALKLEKQFRRRVKELSG